MIQGLGNPKTENMIKVKILGVAVICCFLTNAAFSEMITVQDTISMNTTWSDTVLVTGDTLDPVARRG